MAVIAFDPFTFYDMTVTCHVQGCRNKDRVWNCNLVYSNQDGTPDVTDGRCGQPVEILTAVKSDPQPSVS
ncbi:MULTISPECIES: hypothetical protein [unclassified Streptomyces]|uniref:hypothetical protein n=1 Tax=unclassified Streptomyces TaxID=2593676 RepID=UPI0033260823